MDTTTNEYTTNDNIINNLKMNDYDKINNNFITPKKAIINALISSDILQQRSSVSPINRGDLQSIQLLNISTGPLHILKERYLLTNYNNNNNNKSITNLKCTDIYTEINYKCKLIYINYDKIILAYHKLNNYNLKNYNNYEHDLIKNIHDAVQIDKNRTYLIISNNNYGDLHSYIKLQRRLTEFNAKKLFRQICNTVKLCHNNGIVLRDLKLKNFIFIDSDRTQLQFESLEGSCILDNPDDDTLTEKIGCPLYVAPELITTNLTYGGYAADMWSLGIILYTMLIGRYPFSDINGQILFNKILYSDVTMPNCLISPKARCLIKSLLMKNPSKRLIADDVLDHQWFNDDSYQDNQFFIDDCQIVPDMNIEFEINTMLNS